MNFKFRRACFNCNLIKNEDEIPLDFINDGSRDVSDVPNKRLIVRGLLPSTTPSAIHIFFKSDDLIQVESISDLGFAFLLYSSVKSSASFLGTPFPLMRNRLLPPEWY
jgi:hypothetical protein